MAKKIFGDFEIKDITDIVGPLIGIVAFGFAGYLQVNYISKSDFDKYKEEQQRVIDVAVGDSITREAYELQMKRLEEKMEDQENNINDTIKIIEENRKSLHNIEISLAKLDTLASRSIKENQ
jgi:hypothetical protein